MKRSTDMAVAEKGYRKWQAGKSRCSNIVVTQTQDLFIFLPAIFLPTFLPTIFLPTIFLPTIFLPTIFLPAIFL